MGRAKLSPEQVAVMDELAEFLRERWQIIGPRADNETDCGLDAEDMAELEAVTNPALVEFVVVMQWVDLDTGSSFSTRVNAPEMLNSHVQGLLMEWVD